MTATAQAVEAAAGRLPGAVSVPHGWRRGRPGWRRAVAAARPGASATDLTDERVVDSPSGTVAFDALPVEVGACA